MKCMNKELMAIMPPKIRQVMDKVDFGHLEEIRLRLCRPVTLKIGPKYLGMDAVATGEDIAFVINTASRYSPWSASSMARGYLTAPGGHRIGVCGETVTEGGQSKGIRTPTSLCVRIAKEIDGVANGVDLRDSLLVIGPPGSGKTTMLRDLIRRISQEKRGQISVVDERGEIFPYCNGKPCFQFGDHTDVLTACGKEAGIGIVLRSMGPEWIAVDEITQAEDCRGLIHAAWCGVRILATAHAGSVEDLYRREVYRPLVETKLFRSVLILGRDKSVRQERIVV